MDSGFGVSVSAEDISVSLRNPRPEFRAWVWRAHLRGELDLVIEAIVRAGRAGSVGEALSYLEEYTSEQFTQRTRVGKVDFNTEKPGRQLLKRLEVLLGAGVNSSRYDAFRHHGNVGHSAIPELLVGKLIELGRAKRVKSGAPVASQQYLFDLRESAGGKSDTLRLPLRVTRAYVRRIYEKIEHYWQKLRCDIPPNNLRSFAYPAGKQRRTIRLFVQWIKTIFGDYVHRLRRREIFEDEQAILLTLMEWATAVLYYRREGQRVLFRELPIFVSQFDLGGGRVDALEVRTINGKAPSDLQRHILSRMSQARFKSVGQLLVDLERAFGLPMHVRIIDWKFAVGDNRESIITSEEVRLAPLDHHAQQVREYIALAMLSYKLAKARGRELQEPWDTPGLKLDGELVYFFPGAEPTSHQIALGAAESELVFIESVVQPWKHAERRAQMRVMTNAIVGHAIKILSGNGDPNPAARRNHVEQLALELSPEASGSREARHIVARYQQLRSFADPHQIVERVRFRKGQERLEMYVDRLLAAISEGRIEVGRFDELRGGFICCLLHEERTPSMRISFNRGAFKCFGCGAWGTFAYGSVPQDIQAIIEPFKGSRRQGRDTAHKKVVIPEKHRLIMEIAQQSLASVFRGSEGERYLVRVRGLDPDLAMEYGVGFGAERLIHDLLDAGFSYDDLLFYGFLGLSHRVSSAGRIPSLLTRRGLKPGSIVKRLTIKPRGEKKKEVDAYPYSVLGDRVTFPLALGSAVNNFYGRSIDPSAPKWLCHRKLSVDYTKIPHGAFNLAAVYSDTQLLLVTEGAMDALTFIQAGSHRATAAMIGVNNTVILEEVAGYLGSIAIALDADKTGVKNTAVVMEWLQKRRSKGRVWDWTAAFLEQHPGEPYKDINAWWVRNRKPITINIGAE